MEILLINTKLGKISTQIKIVENTIPIIFLHGVYFDHNLWNYQTSKITDRTVIIFDMPLHGNSKLNVPKTWMLEDCADMLIEILDSLKIPKVIAVGHSWGSMTILRAAYKHPERFQSIGFCNMPYESVAPETIEYFKYLHTLLPLPNRTEYLTHISQALFSKNNLESSSKFLDYLTFSMNKISNSEIIQIDNSSVLIADDATDKIDNLLVPSLVLKGVDDSVPNPGDIELTVVEGTHVSPLEAPNDVLEFVKKVIKKVER
jgi:pimeloyl-ACP methyl ester carboxylesterase